MIVLPVLPGPPVLTGLSGPPGNVTPRKISVPPGKAEYPYEVRLFTPCQR
ncbi:hypothetical protein SLNWT_5634 [Streptomyces albus]|uniref:Uncharacterized protein n=1 Tax=Streptomyces albus (strain ATCC 21838 / DSM 41398 / FERM P-419 / JCM 4703 / NBRC 107858) TaxID=1081613 RepID=A0A0B5F345_STRA4|nr:hypothetical protein SLNWT_5634 [Streptomyces albus]AOU80312.1 hypothetical protein SLNHY_5621 [Streptomyces albus]